MPAGKALVVGRDRGPSPPPRSVTNTSPCCRRRHRTGVDVEIGVEFPQPDLVAACLATQRRAPQDARPLPKEGNHATGDENVPSRGPSPYAGRNNDSEGLRSGAHSLRDPYSETLVTERQKRRRGCFHPLLQGSYLRHLTVPGRCWWRRLLEPARFSAGGVIGRARPGSASVVTGSAPAGALAAAAGVLVVARVRGERQGLGAAAHLAQQHRARSPAACPSGTRRDRECRMWCG